MSIDPGAAVTWAPAAHPPPPTAPRRTAPHRTAPHRTTHSSQTNICGAEIMQPRLFHSASTNQQPFSLDEDEFDERRVQSPLLEIPHPDDPFSRVLGAEDTFHACPCNCARSPTFPSTTIANIAGTRLFSFLVSHSSFLLPHPSLTAPRTDTLNIQP
jgi:hypothetical protein